MGSIICYKHEECNFEYNYFEGVGFRLFAMQCRARSHMQNGEWGEHWKSMIEQYPQGTATIRKALCYCERCKMYFTRPRIKFYIPQEGYHYESDDNKDFVPINIINEHYQLLEAEVLTCPHCDSHLTVMENVSAIPCPVCGKLMKGKDVGNWD